MDPSPLPADEIPQDGGEQPPPNPVPQNQTSGGTPAPDVQMTDVPVAPRARITLPSKFYQITWSARGMFAALAVTLKLFIHAGRVTEVIVTRGRAELRAITASQFRSRAELAGELWKDGVDNKGNRISRPSRCSEDDAKALLGALEVDLLPHLSIVSAVPILTVDSKGAPIMLGRGYHPELDGVYNVCGHCPRPILPADARKALLRILRGFWFATPGDKARAVAALITPALVYGRLLEEHRIPMFIIEANKSQTGKGLLAALIAAIYGERPGELAKRDGGVGSFDEDFSAALLRGSPFIMLDNLKKVVDSSHIESFMTSFGPFYARGFMRAQAPVDRTRYILFATSNGFEPTVDLQNRALRIMLWKRPPGFRFGSYSGLGVLEYVRAHQSFFLGCVHSIVREWIAASRPRTDISEHSFRESTGALDWIIVHLFGEDLKGRLLDFDTVSGDSDPANDLGFEPPDEPLPDMPEDQPCQ